ncbi:MULTISPECIES: hypothetical protein [unclassified Kribbella]|uniref:hypothetical protein n=1 Tax=unclassified Kribbella TaxID=2644121 RepID=UPI00301A2535
MGDLTAAFDALRSVVTSCGLEFELEQVDPNDTTEPTRDMGLPRDFTAAYAAAGQAPNSSIPWVVEELFIFSVVDLAAAQDGYRWSGPERRQLPGWSGDWVVIAAVFGDPFFVDISQSGFPVYFARHGAGEWKPHRVAQTMAAFISALASFEAVLLREFSGDVWDDGGLRSDFHRRLAEAMAEKLDPVDLENFMRTLLE